ncbi:MAG: twin-arginine translocase subunit TatC [Gemmatimonadaceae bacterium]
MAKNPSGEMPFLDHLEELRWRIIWALGALVVGVVAGFYAVVRFDLIAILQKPIAPFLQSKLVVTSPSDPLTITMNFAVIIGLMMASPVILYQVWAFLSPALHRHEKKLVIPVITGAVALFIGGVALAWFFVLPMMLKFLLTFQSASFDPMITASGYFGMVSTLALTFGATFELPVLIIALTALGLVTPKFLGKFRPYALILAFLAGAFLTPGDFFLATLALGAPLYLLYELSIVLAIFIFRKRQARAFAAEQPEPEGA